MLILNAACHPVVTVQLALSSSILASNSRASKGLHMRTSARACGKYHGAHLSSFGCEERAWATLHSSVHAA